MALCFLHCLFFQARCMHRCYADRFKEFDIVFVFVLQLLAVTIPKLRIVLRKHPHQFFFAFRLNFRAKRLKGLYMVRVNRDAQFLEIRVKCVQKFFGMYRCLFFIGD